MSSTAISRAARRVLRVFVVLLFTVLIALAVYVSLGRQLTPMIGNYTPWIEERLSQLLNATVSIDSIHGEWRGFSPRLELRGLQIRGHSAVRPDDAALTLESVRITADIPASLRQLRPVLADTHIDALDLRFMQRPDGSWTLSGLSAEPGGPTPSFDQIFHWMQGLARLQLNDTRLEFDQYQGETLRLQDASVQFQSVAGEHRLNLTATPELSGQALSVRAQLTGSTLSQLAGNAYLTVPEADYAGLLDSVMLWPGVDWELLRLEGEFWLDLSQGRLATLVWRGAGDAVFLAGQATDGSGPERVQIDDANVGWFRLRHDPEIDSWDLQVEELGFSYEGTRWPAGGLQLSYRPSESVDAHVDAIDAGLVNRLLVALAPPGPLRDEVDSFSPRGMLEDLVMTSVLQDGVPLRGRLMTNARDVAISGNRGAPSIWGINGYAEFSFDTDEGVATGFTEVDSQDLMLHLSQLFNDVWIYDHVNGRVRFSLARDDDWWVRLSSSVIVAESDIISGRIQFATEIQTGADRAINLELMVGALRADASRKSVYLPTAPGALSYAQGVLGWVDQAVLGGEGGGSGFIFRGHVHGGSSSTERTLQMFYHVDEGRLRFDPEWPALDDLAGYVLIDDGEVDVRASAGSSLGIAFDSSVASVRANPDGGRWLTVAGDGKGSAQQGLSYLRETPVTRNLGDHFALWEASGTTDFNLELNIPLFIEGAVPEIRLGLEFADNELFIPEYALVAEQVTGRLEYTAADGLESQGLSAVFLGEPVKVDIRADGMTERSGETRIVVNGRAGAEALREWQTVPPAVAWILERAEGDLPYQASLTLPNTIGTASGAGRAPRLQIDTDLQGLALDYPSPFGKAAEARRPSRLALSLQAENNELTLRIEELMQMNLAWSERRPLSGLVYLGPTADDFRVRRLDPSAPGIEILGTVSEVDYDAWASVITSALPEGERGDLAGADIQATAEVVVGALQVAGETFSDVNVRVGRAEDQRWQLSLLADSISGTALAPQRDGAAWQVDLDYLHLARALRDDEQEEGADGAGALTVEHLIAALKLSGETEENNLEAITLPTESIESGEAAAAQLIDLQEFPTVEFELPRNDPLRNLDPRQFPPVELTLGQLTMGGADFGSWQFVLRSDGAGARFDDVRLNLRGLQIGTEQAPAEFRWIYDGEVHRSVLNATVTATDLAQVLSDFGYAPSIESQSARFDARLHWDGSPAYFSALGLNGSIDLRVLNGRFRQRAGVANSALRLISIINFDAVVRRLRFSDDLARAGLSYDEIQGRVHLRDGIVTIEDRLQIIGPASLFQLAGDVNLDEETIDADLYITLPVSDNIPWLSGLAVLNNLINWQLAVGVFLFDRIFGEQVENLTSAHYTLAGPWEGLEPRLYQVFSGGD